MNTIHTVIPANKTNSTASNVWWVIYAIVHFIAFIYALYLSFKCHGKFDLGSFIVAFFCPWIYLIYVFAISKGKMCSDGMYHGKPIGSK